MDENQEYRAFVPLLVREAPELALLYEEHLRDNFNEPLPHVFMGDVTRFMVETYYRISSATGDAQYWSQVFNRVMEVLEGAAASSNMTLVNLVTVSFCENLLYLEHEDPSAYYGIQDKMGPKLTEQLHAILEYWRDLNSRLGR